MSFDFSFRLVIEIQTKLFQLARLTDSLPGEQPQTWFRFKLQGRFFAIPSYRRVD